MRELLKSDDDYALRKLIYAYPDETEDGLKLYEIVSSCGEAGGCDAEEDIDRVMTQVKYVDFELPDRLNGQLLQDVGVAPGPKMGGEIIKGVRPMLASGGELKSIDEAVEYIHKKNY